MGKMKKMPDENITQFGVLLERLDKVEVKIDKLSDAMIALARTEERILSMEAERKTVYDRLNRHSEKLEKLSMIANDNKNKLSTTTKLFWIVVTVGVTTTMTNLFNINII